jgi:putative transposase
VELIRAEISEPGWRMVELEIMPNHGHLFVTVHPSDSPSPVTSQFKGLTSRRLWAKFPHLSSRLPALCSRSCTAAAAGAVSAETVRQCTGTQNGRPWWMGGAQ